MAKSPIYFGYRLTGDDWFRLAAQVQMEGRPRMIGFNGSEFRAEATPRGIELLSKRNGTTSILNDGLGAVCRLSYDAVTPNHLLLTGVYLGRTASFVHDLSTGMTQRVRSDGRDVYKFTFLPDGRIAYAMKGVGEDRRLHADMATLDEQDAPIIATDRPEPAPSSTVVTAARAISTATPNLRLTPTRRPCSCGGKQSSTTRAAPVTPSLAARAVGAVNDAASFAASGFQTVDRAEYQRRLTICDACDRRQGQMCLQCGCVLAVKAWGAAWHCPLDKW